MEVSREDRVRMERAHVLAWPALRSDYVDGWLWRSSCGGSQRANSVSTIDFAGSDLDTAIDAIELRYRALGAPVRFQTFDETQPDGLADALRRRGYAEGEATLTMFRRPGPVPEANCVEVRDDAWDDWRAVYLGAITESRRSVNQKILEAVPQPRAFFGSRGDKEIISIGLCVVGFSCAVVECVATRSDSVRQGGARAAMVRLLSWAADQGVDLIGLQVVASNTPAIRLYESLGFRAGAINRFWVG